MIRAFVFDFDGVLADTEDLHFETFARVLAGEGIRIDRAMNDSRFLGLDDASGFALAFRDAGREVERERIEELVREKARLFARGVRGVKLFPGAFAAIRAARSRGPVTVASCGARRDIEAVMVATGIRRYFPCFVSAEDLSRPKPDPECFLRALALLRRELPDLAPGECLVFEDSSRGVEAARRAGMRSIALTTSCPAERLSAADLILATLLDWRPEEDAVRPREEPSRVPRRPDAL